MVGGSDYRLPARLGFLQPYNSTADRYFRELGVPPGAGPLTNYRHHDRDGLQNEDASGSYRVPLSRNGVLSHYRSACRRLGLASPASAETLAYHPGALCDGSVIVTVEPRCTGASCDVIVEVIG
jgi:hypothetical protein